MEQPIKLKRKIGQAYIRYKLRTGRGSSYTGEIEGLKAAFTGGGVVILLIQKYTGWLPPLWVIPLIWVFQKAFEYFMGWADEKYFHLWHYEANYQSEHLNPYNKDIKERIIAIQDKLNI